ncbi:Glucokinase [Pseudodesulfovibrio profundus]|uniref:Glucokinase n=2 Tax=Pseudodesulfovibrio profundus TaxID=57320 RepID=A0A2C8F412_9BACT|nr:Glucokinase [Pseudodesulfovibrio profundus]
MTPFFFDDICYRSAHGGCVTMVKILAADIGGTNSRFAVFESTDGELKMEDSIWLQTHDVESFPLLLEQLWDSDFSGTPGSFDSITLAVAGAVSHERKSRYLPNIPWEIDLDEVDFGTSNAALINDFAAQAYACRTSAINDSHTIQKGEAEPDSVIAVIGAGTGLGYSALLPSKSEWTALASEGGHMAFPFNGQEEFAYAEFNRRESKRNWPEGDSVVTGLGLRLLHKYLTGNDLSPKEISEVVTPESETTKWYARFYGRACRDWALSTMCYGGIYIAGGIASKNKLFVDSPDFLAEFHNSHVYESFLHTVPVILNVNEESGLYGAAFYASQLRKSR